MFLLTALSHETAMVTYILTDEFPDTSDESIAEVLVFVAGTQMRWLGLIYTEII